MSYQCARCDESFLTPKARAGHMNAHASRKAWKTVKAFEVTQACGHTTLLQAQTPAADLARVAAIECVECAVSLMSDE